MREIKFRAWDKREKLMLSWEHLCDEDKSLLNDGVCECLADYFNCAFSNIEPLMQYTGLHDKNGKEIYEGDIVCPDKNIQNEKTVGKVVWHSYGAACYYVEYKDGTGWRDFIDMEVIGNIYENPELLGGTHDKG
jgi:uncharacterized phage protein (TIGR01671 family)